MLLTQTAFADWELWCPQCVSDRDYVIDQLKECNTNGNGWVKNHYDCVEQYKIKVQSSNIWKWATGICVVIGAVGVGVIIALKQQADTLIAQNANILAQNVLLQQQNANLNTDFNDLQVRFDDLQRYNNDPQVVFNRLQDIMQNFFGNYVAAVKGSLM